MACPPPWTQPAAPGHRVAENGSPTSQAGVVARTGIPCPRWRVQLVNVICTKAGVGVGSLCHGWFSVLANGSVLHQPERGHQRL